MKKFIFGVMVVAGLAFASGSSRSWFETTGTTRETADPNNDNTPADSGFSLGNCVGLSVFLHGASGQTFRSGTLQYWKYSTRWANDAGPGAGWARDSDLDLTVHDSAARSQSWSEPGVVESSSMTRGLYACSGVVSDGGTVLLSDGGVRDGGAACIVEVDCTYK